MKKNILIVDDIESIRIAIADYLSNFYQVITTENGYHALDLLKKNQIHMVISDIRMPDMDGITLIQNIQNKYPDIKYALITAYNVNDYIHYARKYKIWNVIPKTSFLDLSYIKTMVYKLLSGDIFGYEKYFENIEYKTITIVDLYKFQRKNNYFLQNGICYEIRIQSEEERVKINEIVFDNLQNVGAPGIFRTIIEELTINARDYGTEFYQMEIKILFGYIQDKILFGVIDYNGKLDFENILHKLERNISLDKNGLPLSINDENGRGLFITRENVDHLIFNLKENQKTEILTILEKDNSIRSKTISMYKIS